MNFLVIIIEKIVVDNVIKCTFYAFFWYYCCFVYKKYFDDGTDGAEVVVGFCFFVLSYNFMLTMV